MDDPIASILVQKYQQERHHNNHDQQNQRVANRIPYLGAGVTRRLMEWRVDQVNTILGRVEAHRVDRQHHHQHAECDWKEQQNDVFRSILEDLALFIVVGTVGAVVVWHILTTRYVGGWMCTMWTVRWSASSR